MHFACVLIFKRLFVVGRRYLFCTPQFNLIHFDAVSVWFFYLLRPIPLPFPSPWHRVSLSEMLKTRQGKILTQHEPVAKMGWPVTLPVFFAGQPGPTQTWFCWPKAKTSWPVIWLVFFAGQPNQTWTIFLELFFLGKKNK